MHNKHASDVLARLKTVFAVKSDTELAKALHTSAQTISSWKSRDSIPYAICVDISTQKNLSLDWLICGRGEMQRESRQLSVNEPVDNYDTDARVRLLLALFRDLNDGQQQEILRDVQEKQRITTMQRQIEQLLAEMETLKKLD